MFKRYLIILVLFVGCKSEPKAVEVLTIPKGINNSIKLKNSYKTRFSSAAPDLCKKAFQELSFTDDSLFKFQVKCSDDTSYNYSIHGKVMYVDDSTLLIGTEFSQFKVRVLDENNLSIIKAAGKIPRLISPKHILTYRQQY